MFLHLGASLSVPLRSIIGIFDLEKDSRSRLTQDFLRRAQEEGRVVSAGEALPASFVLCQNDGKTTVYLSPIAPRTLARRARRPYFSDTDPQTN